MPAASSTICIGSAYCRANARQRGSWTTASNLLGPYLARRVVASSVLRPAPLSTCCSVSTFVSSTVCQIGSSTPDVPFTVTTDDAFIARLPSRVQHARHGDVAQWDRASHSSPHRPSPAEGEQRPVTPKG